MQEAFLRAMENCPDESWESRYAIAGQSARLRIHGRALAERISRPLAHLRSAGIDPGPARLSIDIWDGAASGVHPPLGSRTEYLEKQWTVEGEFLSASADGRFVRYQRLHALAWFDRRAGHLIEWWSSAGACTVGESSKPLRMLLPIWCEQQGMQLIHAGLVSRHGRGVLIAGPSGAGKSTTSLACLAAGFDFLSDDCTGLQESEGLFIGHSLYSSARLERDHLTRFPFLRGHAVASDDRRSGKALLPVAEIYPSRTVRAVPIRAVVLPRVGDSARPRLRAASRGQALLVLAPSTLLTPLSSGRRGLEQLARLVDQVPSYWLELGRDLSLIPGCLERVLEAVAE
jgi:hypothetical protein